MLFIIILILLFCVSLFVIYNTYFNYTIVNKSNIILNKDYVPYNALYPQNEMDQTFLEHQDKQFNPASNYINNLYSNSNPMYSNNESEFNEDVEIENIINYAEENEMEYNDTESNIEDIYNNILNNKYDENVENAYNNENTYNEDIENTYDEDTENTYDEDTENTYDDDSNDTDDPNNETNEIYNEINNMHKSNNKQEKKHKNSF